MTVSDCLPLHNCLLCSLLRCYPCRQKWSESERQGPLRMTVASSKDTVRASTVRLCASQKSYIDKAHTKSVEQHLL